jgi:hypothetical protein
MNKNELDACFPTELSWHSAIGKVTKISELDHQYLSNILWFNEVFNKQTRYNDWVQLALELELTKRFPDELGNGFRLQWKPLPIPSEIKWIKEVCGVDRDGNIWWNAECIGSLSHIECWYGSANKSKILVKHDNTEEPMSFKERLLRFVESKGTATFTEIQEFSFDFKYGKGKYRQGVEIAEVERYDHDNHKAYVVTIKQNIHRGMFCGDIYRNDGFWVTGPSRLVKVKRGIYKATRDNNEGM